MTSTVAPPQDLQAEEAVLGAVLLSDTAMRPVLEAGLRPEHFYRERHGFVFQAMVELHDAQGGIDPITLTNRLRDNGTLHAAGGHAAVESLAGPVPAVGNVREYAAIIVARYRHRVLLNGAYDLQTAIRESDEAGVTAALDALAAPTTERAGVTSSPAELAEKAYERYQQTDVELFPLPLDRLNMLLAGGPRRGEYVGLGGHSSHGKSVFCDQWLEEAVKHGHKAGLYVTEMTEDERVDRIISRLSGVPLTAIRWRNWNPRQQKEVLDSLSQIPFSITSAHDWTAEEIRRHIEFSAFDAVAIDTLHDVARPSDMGEEPGLRHISAQLRAAAKSKGRERALLAVVHLNDTRVDDYPPLPVNRDVRGSGMIVRHLDTLVMVWQKPDDEKEPSGEGVIRITKARQGQLGHIGAFFNGRRVRWEPLYVEEAAA